MMNYYIYHGATIPDEEIEILMNARWKGYKIIQHILQPDGNFYSVPCMGLYTFAFQGQLYYFERYKNRRIKSIHQLNMRKEDAGKFEDKSYYQLILVLRKKKKYLSWDELFRVNPTMA